MKILISAASRHGSTSEMAEAIADALAREGIEADVRRPEEVASVAAYDGVVLGSGVYAGRWLGPVKQLIERESAALATRPVWLFSSGPLGDPLKPEQDPEDVALLVKQIHPVEHRTFAGKIDKRQLGIAEKAIFAVVRAPEGDFRPWPAIAEWASEIAATMRARAGQVAAV
ncbi:MAG: flavodoxin domain-containing protein [Chloroflexi bacterium]|nr:flavodoxin domain-containing protein [Chloroflexota bacterium]